MKRTSGLGLLILILIFGAACAPEVIDDGSEEHHTFSLTENAITVISSATNLKLVPVEPKPGDGPDEIAVTRSFTASKMIGDVRADWSMKDGHTLRLGITCSGFVTECEARHLVEVPSDVKVKVQARDGSVAASGFSAPLNLEVKNGNINIDESSSPLILRAADGSIRAKALAASSVSAKTRNGYLILAFREAPTSVHTESRDGSTTIKAPRTPYDVTTKVTDGSAKVTVPDKEGADRSIDARASNGSIKIRPS